MGAHCMDTLTSLKPEPTMAGALLAVMQSYHLTAIVPIANIQPEYIGNLPVSMQTTQSSPVGTLIIWGPDPSASTRTTYERDGKEEEEWEREGGERRKHFGHPVLKTCRRP